MTEVWKTVRDSWPYEVSDLGRIRRTHGIAGGTHPGKVLKPYQTGRGYREDNGYMTVDFHEAPRRRKTVKVHLTVAAAFLPSRPAPWYQFNHRDGDKKNNAALNLEWVTGSDNMKHAVRTGLVKRPIARRTRFSEGQIEQAQALVTAGMRLRDAGRVIGISASHLCSILNGKKVPKSLEAA